MGRIVGVRRIMAMLVVMGTAAAGLAVGAGSVGAREARPAPNCQISGPVRGPAAEPAVPEIIIEPPPVEEVTCATLRVTKVVQGTAPAGTTFTVLVQCTSTGPDRRSVAAQELPEGHVPPFTTALTFSETGGTQDVLIAGLSSCAVSETPPPPECTLAGITPSTTEITGPDVFPVFVTNRCAPPVPAVAPAQAQAQGERTVVVPVVGAPRFTG